MSHTILNTGNRLRVCGNNYYGQLGLGHAEPVNVLTKCDFFENHELQILDTHCGTNFTIVNTTHGLYVFGRNDFGQLGLGSGVESVSVPTKLDFFDHYGIISISCGFSHVIINTTDGLYVFGNNNQGQLGLGNVLKKVHLPTKLDFFENNKLEIHEIYCDSNQTLIRTKDGFYTFGCSEYEKLILGTSIFHYQPTKYAILNNLDLDIIDVYLGSRHTIINTRNGLYGFGSNKWGELGLGNVDYVNTPIKLDFFNDLEIIDVFCGSSYTMVWTTDGLYSFGFNEYGWLGLNSNLNDDNGCIKLPAKICLNADAIIISIHCGYGYMIIDTTNGLYVFGSNYSGQLGLGDFDERNTVIKHDFKIPIISKNKNTKARIKSARFV